MRILEDERWALSWGDVVRRVLYRHFSDGADEPDGEWGRYICKQKRMAVDRLTDEPNVYRFLIEKKAVTAEWADELLTKITDVECRSILLEFMGNKRTKNKSTDDIIDGMFSLD